VAVTGLNFPILPMDKQLRPLILSDFARAMLSVRFSIEGFGDPLGPLTPNCPGPVVWDNMLVAFCTHLYHPCHGMIAAH